MSEDTFARLVRAKDLLAIAERVDSDPKAAKTAAYRGAAEEIAAYIEETGATQRSIAIELGGQHKEKTVHALLKWRREGYKGASPFLADGQATTRAAVSHGRKVLREQPKTLMKEVATAMKDDEVVEELVDKATPTVRKKLRDHLDTQEVKDMVARSERARHAATQAARPRPLSAHFWSILNKLNEWERALAGIQDQLSTLSPAEQEKVRERYTRLRDRLEAGLLEMHPTHDTDDVIEGRVYEPRTLTQ